MVKNPIPNTTKFQANSIGGKVTITHHTLINLFGVRSQNLKFFLLPTLRSFHGILGNDSLKKLNAIIFTSKNYMIINDSLKVHIKQQLSESVNNLNISSDHLTD